MTDKPLEHMGFGTFDVPFIWLPDADAGRRPGYPWVEAGRMTLNSARSAVTARATADRPAASLHRRTISVDAPIQQEPLPPLPPAPPPLPPTMRDTDLGRDGLLPWKQPDFMPGTNDRIYIPPDSDPPGPIDPKMHKFPPGPNVPTERFFREASDDPDALP